MRYQGETEDQAKAREQKNYEEFLTHAAEMKRIYKSASPQFAEFFQWMIDVYCAEQCGRYRGKPYLVRGS